MKKIENVGTELYALSPLDGRYSWVAKELGLYFSEAALIRERLEVEVLWLQCMIKNVGGCEVFQQFENDDIYKILEIAIDFEEEGLKRVKEIEKVTNHDVKAVELYVAEELDKLGFSNLKSFVHIGCTSEDITNLAYAKMIRNAISYSWSEYARGILGKLEELVAEYANIPMLAHTHGQPATPTTVGKELVVFEERLDKALEIVLKTKICGKFNGATGNYSAIAAAFPVENWPALSEHFVSKCLDFEFNSVTTQIENHDWMCELFDNIVRFNNIVLDLNLDMWLYVSRDIFKLIPKEGEVGSSTMPHKVNPINFENSEANIAMSNAIFKCLSDKLSRSRMQRDLSDSSIQRNIGVAFGYSIQALSETLKGLEKVCVNEKKLDEQLENNWAVLAEPIQTMLRKYCVPDAYDKLKELTRGKKISKEDIQNLVKTLDFLSDEDMETLMQLTPQTYIGYAADIALLNY